MSALTQFREAMRRDRQWSFMYSVRDLELDTQCFGGCVDVAGPCGVDVVLNIEARIREDKIVVAYQPDEAGILAPWPHLGLSLVAAVQRVRPNDLVQLPLVERGGCCEVIIIVACCVVIVVVIVAAALTSREKRQQTCGKGQCQDYSEQLSHPSPLILPIE